MEDMTRELLCIAGGGGRRRSPWRRDLVIRVWLRSREWEEREREGEREGGREGGRKREREREGANITRVANTSADLHSFKCLYSLCVHAIANACDNMFVCVSVYAISLTLN